jgi:hypothetical protein
MKTILINQSHQPTSRVFENGYKIDGKSVSAEELAKQGLIELEYIDTPQPTTTTNQVATSQWQVTENGYERVWAIRDKTEQELRQEDWVHDYALRIIVPKALIQQYREILIFKSYFEVMGLPIEILPDEIHVYCNEILLQDIERIKELMGHGVMVEPMDEIAEQYLVSIGILV